jgi:gluconokinase
MIVIVMGVAGSGKTTVGRALAQRLGWAYHDGDDYHPAANVAKMRAGTPLDDDDRQPWLAALNALARRSEAANESIVIACSALKAQYRTWLAANLADFRFVYLRGSRELIGQRLAARSGHFMPPGLLDSQFAALEEPVEAIVIDVDRAPEELVAIIAAAVRARPAHPDRAGA